MGDAADGAAAAPSSSSSVAAVDRAADEAAGDASSTGGDVPAVGIGVRRGGARSDDGDRAPDRDDPAPAPSPPSDPGRLGLERPRPRPPPRTPPPPRDRPAPSLRSPALPRPRPSLRRSASASFSRSVRDLRGNLRRHSSKSFRALKRQSSSLVEAVSDSLPVTPSGWALFALSAASVGLQYELKVQRELTAPPLVFCQTGREMKNGGGDGRDGGSGRALNDRTDRIYAKLLRGEDDTAFSRDVTPSLFVGTRGLAASVAAYALGDRGRDRGATAGGRRGGGKKRARRMREVMTMGADGAKIVLDWELPATAEGEPQIDVRKANSIDRPVILLLHGLNNDSSFGYIRSMMRTATERGWIAAGMNFRGQDGLHQVKNSTPRGYNAGYTGDLRGVVQQIEHRLKRREVSASNRRNTEDDDPYVGGPIFVLGYSLGANIITKYLGEESLHGTLPKCIGGGAALGNPLHIHSGTIPFPWNVVLGAGVKRSILQNFRSFRGHGEPGFRRAITKALLSPTIGKLDDAAAPYLIRNDPFPPYTPRIGFRDGEEYWHDASSHRHVGHVSVPLLKVSARDDFLVFGQFSRKLNHCLENPNVVVVKTRCGGHLGWQESPPPGGKGGQSSGSWSDVAVADFIEALLQIREEDRRRKSAGVRGGDDPGRESARPPKVLSKL